MGVFSLLFDCGPPAVACGPLKSWKIPEEIRANNIILGKILVGIWSDFLQNLPTGGRGGVVSLLFGCGAPAVPCGILKSGKFLEKIRGKNNIFGKIFVGFLSDFRRILSAGGLRGGLVPGVGLRDACGAMRCPAEP